MVSNFLNTVYFENDINTTELNDFIVSYSKLSGVDNIIIIGAIAGCWIFLFALYCYSLKKLPDLDDLKMKSKQLKENLQNV